MASSILANGLEHNPDVAPVGIAAAVAASLAVAANTLGFGNVGFGKLDFGKFVDFKVVKDEKQDEKEDPKEIKIIVEKVSTANTAKVLS